MEMTTSTGTAMRRLKGIKREDSTFGKVDLVLYPGVMLVNNVTYKLYKAALDPATRSGNAIMEGGFATDASQSAYRK